MVASTRRRWSSKRCGAARVRACLLAAGVLLSGCASSGTVQRAAPEFEMPDATPPLYAAGAGPRVGIDEAHGNYHTAGGRYVAFASLLERDGYRVGGFAETFTAESLAAVDLLVISNAVHPDNAEAWTLPNPSAFTDAEIAAVEAWVGAGGSLMLVADHMPMPGAAATLARAFGVIFHDGFAYAEDGEGRMSFGLDDGLLARHAVTDPAGEAADIPFVTTFTGQAFRLLGGVDADPLMTMPEGAYLLLPSEAWEFDETTPRIAADGLLQGALIRHGAGRVAMFGEAAAFSAQIQERDDGEIVRMGMNDPAAPHNAQFLLNVIHWLTAAR